VLPGEGLVSLGTSDVVLVSTESYNPHPEYHAFFHPAQIAPPSVQDDDKREVGPIRYFNMLVYKSESGRRASLRVHRRASLMSDGSLAREHVRDEYYAKSWDAFNAAVESGRPKTGSDLPDQAAFWWLLPDIIVSDPAPLVLTPARRCAWDLQIRLPSDRFWDL
jgi:xylulokinase